ncbi:hypothetical protein GCM10007416_33390 [Kroppenstedtia guangzhouensis]|uniref:Pre-toxin TG n=1 Tax=Kroppenstedtia guangzhouensis TaxID=1274356 RepID=A0ABQ1H440_9BACL|nr:hypothetical protein [Kroppenstedtia guangzhouensis]GGA57484.1 hypothetical protein GCM10007416_33390 [Kroppenstedtia guangzhouensis]
MGLDGWQAVDNWKHISQFVRSPSEIRAAWQAAMQGERAFSTASNWSQFLGNASKPLKVAGDYVARPLKAAGKLAPIFAAVDVGISTAEAIENFSNNGLKSVDGWANVGEVMMSGAVVLSASGVGAPVAAGVAVVGGVIWGVSKGIKHWDTIKETGRKVVNGVKALKDDPVGTTKKAFKVAKDKIGGAVDTVKGWFS